MVSIRRVDLNHDRAAWFRRRVCYRSPMRSLLPLVLLSLAACGAPGRIHLVESWPAETSLDNADIADAAPTWVEMVDAARETLEFEEFYGATAPESALEPVLEAISRAAARGVRVRFLFDDKLLKHNQEVPARLREIPGVEVRIIDFGAAGGGVQHMKLFLVDGREAFLGSQNFDWRSLTHIQELGIRTDAAHLVEPLRRIFEADWALAGGGSKGDALAGPPVAATRGPARFRDAEVDVELVASPEGWLPPGVPWDLPVLEGLLGAATRTVRLQVMSYSVLDFHGEAWRRLDDALRATAARGVSVQLLVADWSKREKSLAALRALARLDNLTVRFATVPQHSGGFVPFARVAHCKYLVVDDAQAWLGTSNWEQGYFTESRNAGVVVRGAPFAKALAAFFAHTWTSPYAEALDPEAEYAPPRISLRAARR